MSHKMGCCFIFADGTRQFELLQRHPDRVDVRGAEPDPGYPQRLRGVVGRLQRVFGGAVKVCKLEPWNSVRVTLSIPREAALRLKQLAADGSHLLRALGILSVQVDNEQVISLRIAGPTSFESQEVLLRPSQDVGECGNLAATTSGGGCSSSNTSRVGLGDMLSGLLSASGTSQLSAGSSKIQSQPEKVQFKSPNVVCPSDSVVPRSSVPVAKPHAGPFPFTSMNQALHSSAFVAPKPKPKLQMPPPPPPPPPPPYPTTMSSPLLVNLLQNDSATTSAGPSPTSVRLRTQPSVPVPMRHSSVLVNSSPSPSALARPAPSASAPPPPPPVHFAQVPHQPKTFMPPPPPPPKPVPASPVSSLGGGVPPVDPFAHHSMDPHPLDTHRIDPQVIDAHAQRIEPNVLDSSRLDQQLLDLQTLDIHALDTHAIDPQVLDRHLDMRNLRPPPPYSEAVARNSWQPLMDLTPALPDLKADDLDEILPSLEDLNSPPLLPEDLLSTSPLNLPPVPDRRHFLINPLTGELEPHSGGESEVEDVKDVFKGLESPVHFSDEDSGSTIRPDNMTDHSDGESRCSQIMMDGVKASRIKNKVREKGRDSPTMKPTEKIKLRLKLEKTEPPSPAYKVDVSFINTQPKKAATSVMGGSPSSTPPDGELRVPPLHISLKGRNHVVITNKKKTKVPGEKAKLRRLQEHPNKLKKADSEEEAVVASSMDSLIAESGLLLADQLKSKNTFLDMKKAKKLKMNHDCKEPNNSVVGNAAQHLVMNDVLLKNRMTLPDPPPYKERREDPPPPYKERTDDPPPYKERRSSDSELLRSMDKYADSNGVAMDDKKLRLGQTDVLDPGEPPTTVPGSTNIGTISALPQKVRKDKLKGKDAFRSLKEMARNKNHSMKLTKQVSLPTGDVDMEAKFKQRLLEGSGPPHRTEAVHQVTEAASESAPPNVELDKCNTTEQSDSVNTANSNSNNSSGSNVSSCSISSGGSNSGGSTGSAASAGTREGEDSGIESMDALSEKSPNQVGQSPPTDTISKTQVPDILDIEAQLAKMEGQCCEATVPVKEEELDPVPVRVTPPLYTYSNPEKARSESPNLSDDDSNSCSGTGLSKSKSLLEQLLIDIPEQQPVVSVVSPNARTVRTRAATKLSSPELNSPVSVKSVAKPPGKRKRQESEGSNASLEELGKNKKLGKKAGDAPSDLVKGCLTVMEVSKVNNNQGKKSPPLVMQNQSQSKGQDESSDSDEPLMEKVRKTSIVTTGNAVPPVKGKVKPAAAAAAAGAVVPNNNKNTVSTRRSTRTAIPAANTRSKGDKPLTTTASTEPDIARRKTRSAASEVDKRKKEVK